jgi:hypothetical protein
MRARLREDGEMPERRREVALVASPDEELCAADLDEELGGGRKKADDAHRAKVAGAGGEDS